MSPGVLAVVKGVGSLVILAAIIVFGLKRANHNKAAASKRQLAAAAVEAAKPVPTDLQQMHTWMEDLVRKIDTDARARQASLQWFLFMLPLIYSVLWGIFYMSTR